MGVYYNRARYYNQRVGRFSQMDSYLGRESDPITLNKYLYANGNPVMYTDPSGEMTIAGIMAGINGQANMQNRRTRNAVTKVKDMATTLCKNISQLAGKFDDHHAFPVFLGGTRKHGHTGDVFVDEYVHSILHGLMGQMFILNGLPHGFVA